MNTVMRIVALTCLLLMASFSTLQAEEVINMEGSTVVGNRELPKVLYIVPWQQAELPDMSELPLNGLINDALSPVDREVFQRQVKFHYQLTE